MANEGNEARQMKFGDKVIIRETPNTKERGIANQPGVITKVDGEEIHVVYKGQFGSSGPYKLKIDEVEKVIQGGEKKWMIKKNWDCWRELLKAVRPGLVSP